MKRALVGFMVMVLVLPGLLFVAAGTVAWPMAWAYAAVVILGSGGAHVAVARKHPDTLVERARGLRVEGTAPWDRRLAPIVVWTPVLAMVVAGLDHRLQWSSVGGLPVQIGALAAAAAGYGLGAWAMAENRFFAAGARIQHDRGHTVVGTGPYRWVRHPGYAAAVLATMAIPLVLDSVWAFIPAAIGVAALVVRTALEDRMLRERLDGYEAFAGRTRCRLIPGVW